MNITILTSSQNHPVYGYLQQWEKLHSAGNNVDLITDVDSVAEGDFLFLISCSEIIPETTRNKFKYCLVVHASDLPNGRGWSPHIWQIVEGKNDIIVSLLEAEDKVDTGQIWLQKTMHFAGHELYDEINEKLFQVTLDLMTEAINNYDDIIPEKQLGKDAVYYPKRTPEDSQIDISLPIEGQFDLLRVVDPDRFPAFFEYRGHRYTIKIEKDD